MARLTDRPDPLSPGAYWELLMNLTRREIKGRYSQSFFGAGWAIAQPLATMAVFTLVFARLGQMPSGGAPYPLFAYAALVPWFFFSNSVASGTTSLVTYRNIVTKTYFPREIVPLAQVALRWRSFARTEASCCSRAGSPRPEMTARARAHHPTSATRAADARSALWTAGRGAGTRAEICSASRIAVRRHETARQSITRGSSADIPSMSTSSARRLWSSGCRNSSASKTLPLAASRSRLTSTDLRSSTI